LISDFYSDEVFRRTVKPDPSVCAKKDGVEVVCEDGFWQVRPERSVGIDFLHTNACGDFTLLSREGWNAIRGYPEFEAFSFNIDSMGMLAAHYSGYEEVSLLPPCVCFHIEHGIGSGWTPEGEKKLFNRLRDAGILNPEWPVLTPLVDEMRDRRKHLEFNHAGWGMADFDLPERAMGDMDVIPAEKLNRLALQARSRDVSSIQPAYDLDRLTLMHERRWAQEQNLASNLGLTLSAEAGRVVVYIPDFNGRYSEKNTIGYHVSLLHTTTLIFRLEKFAYQYPLRFDPCQFSGLICIESITAFDGYHNKVVWELDGDDVDQLTIRGTAVLAKPAPSGGSNGRQPLWIVSTGVDPQLMLPTLPRSVGFPLVLSVEMRFIPSK
jgi:hypothetical protein